MQSTDTKFQRRSIRLPQYDYSDYGYYFVTICTHQWKLLFGNIINGQMNLNQLGEIVRHEWINIPKYYNGQVLLDIFVVMPNHLHGIIIINPNPDIHQNVGATLAVAHDVTKRVQIIQKVGKNYQGKQRAGASPAPTLGNIIGAYKSRCFKTWREFCHTRRFSESYLKFWQRNYYEHIIRDENDYANIWQYIDYNPDKWQWDKNNPKNF